MIEYDYSLVKNDGFETKTFTPLFDTKISNVATFRGHNSSGKSTFMDLVALSFYGTDSPEVISKLKEKLGYLRDANNSDFDFKLNVSNSNITLRARTKKSGFIEGSGEWDCVVEESRDDQQFKELTKEEFRQKYRLIYDMPDRPMERVKELVREAERIIREKKDSVDLFRQVLSDEIVNAEKSRDEDLIFLLKNELMQKKENISTYEDDVDQLKKMSKKLYQLHYTLVFNKLNSDLNEVNQKIQNLNSDRTKKEKAKAKENKDYEVNLRKIKSQLRNLVDNYRICCNKLDHLQKINPSDIQPYLQFGYMVPDSIIKNGCSQLYDFRKVSKELINIIDSAYQDEGSTILSEKKKLLGELVTALEPYLSDNIEVLDSPINQIYEKLSLELKQIQADVGEFDTVQEILNRMNSACEFAKTADSMYENLGAPPDLDSYDESESGIASGLNARRESILKQIKDTSEKAAVFGVTSETLEQVYETCQNDILLRDYLNLSIEEILEKANEISKSIDSKNQKISDLKARVGRLSNDLEDAESRESHPLSDYRNELSVLQSTVTEMVRDFNEKALMLDKLTREDTVPETEKNIDFLENVWIYLGKRLDTIQHIGTVYKIQKIDMNHHSIITDVGATIQFKDMGTGESQLAYLTGLLNSDDDRITIAMFDEIDHMDPNIISKIQFQLKTLYKSGKLLMGIMAAPGTTPEVVNCE